MIHASNGSIERLAAECAADAGDDRSPVETAAGTFYCRAISDRDEIAALVPAWRALARSEQPSSFFSPPEVWQSWAATHGQPGPILAVHRGATIVGLMPLMLRSARRGPTLGVRYDYDPRDARFLVDSGTRPVSVRQLSPALSLSATMLGPVPITLPDCRAEVIGALARGLSCIRNWDVAVLPVREDDLSLWLDALRAGGFRARVQRIDRGGYSLAPIVPFDEVVSRQSKNFRKNVRRARAAAETGGVRLSITHTVPEILAVIQTLAEASWKHHGRPGQDIHVPYSGLQQAFFEDLISSPRLDADPVMAMASLDGRAIAACLSAVHGETLTTLLIFWNGEVADASPGILILGELIDYAHQAGLQAIEYNSNSPFIRYIANEVSMSQNILAFAPTLRGQGLAGLSATAGILRHWTHKPGART